MGHAGLCLRVPEIASLDLVAQPFLVTEHRLDVNSARTSVQQTRVYDRVAGGRQTGGLAASISSPHGGALDGVSDLACCVLFTSDDEVFRAWASGDSGFSLKLGSRRRIQLIRTPAPISLPVTLKTLIHEGEGLSVDASVKEIASPYDTAHLLLAPYTANSKCQSRYRQDRSRQPNTLDQIPNLIEEANAFASRLCWQWQNKFFVKRP